MKTFNYFGKPLTVPDYAKYIATDSDGEVWWFTDKPRYVKYIRKLSGVNVAWFNFSGSNCGRVGNNPNVKNWRRSLREC